MLHAKTAVADGRWARVGSSNLNLSSWLANWELDVAVEDERFGHEMEEAYAADLSRATEVVLGARRPRTRGRPPRSRAPHRRREGSAVAAAGALRLGNAVGAALGGYRVLGPAEARLLALAAVVLLVLGAVTLTWPEIAAIPPAVLSVWLAIALLVKAWKLRRARRREMGGGDEPARAAGGDAGGEGFTRADR
jgi:cardiolipin synthase